MSKKKYEISLIGCHAVTEVYVLLSETEVKFIQNLAKKITKKSRDSCEPTMEIRKVGK